MMMQAVTRPPRAGYSGEKDPDLLKRRGSRWLTGLRAPEAGTARWSRPRPSCRDPRDERGSRRCAPGQQPGPIRACRSCRSTWGDAEERARMRSVAALRGDGRGRRRAAVGCANVANLLLVTRGGAPPRDRRPPCARREPSPPRAPAAHRERAAFACFGGLAGLLLLRRWSWRPRLRRGAAAG